MDMQAGIINILIVVVLHNINITDDITIDVMRFNSIISDLYKLDNEYFVWVQVDL